MALTVTGVAVAARPETDSHIRVATVAATTPRPQLSNGWTSEPTLYAVELDSQLHASGNGLGSHGDGVGSDAYAWPGGRPANPGAITFLHDGTRFYTDPTVSVPAVVIASERVTVHSPDVLGPMRRVAVIYADESPSSTWPDGLHIDFGVADDLAAHEDSFDRVSGFVLEASTPVSLGAAFLDPSTDLTPLALFTQYGSTLTCRAFTCPTQTGLWPTGFTWPDPVLQASVTVAEGMLTDTLSDGAFRSHVVAPFGTNRVVLAYVTADEVLHVATVSWDGAGGLIVTSAFETPVAGVVRLGQMVTSEDGTNVAFVVQTATQHELFQFRQDGSTPTLACRTGLASPNYAHPALVGDDHRLVAVTKTITASPTTIKVYAPDGSLASTTSANPDGSSWLRQVACHGWADGRFAVLAPQGAFSETTEAITEGNCQLYRLEGDTLTLVDQVLGFANSDSTPYDWVLPIGPDTVYAFDSVTHDYTQAAFFGGISKGVWFNNVGELDNGWIGIASGEVGYAWPTSEDLSDPTARPTGLHVAAVQLNTSGVPIDSTAQRHTQLWYGTDDLLATRRTSSGPVMPVSDTVFAVAANGSFDKGASDTEKNRMHILFYGLEAGLPLIADVIDINPVVSTTEWYLPVNAVRVRRTRTVILAVNHVQGAETTTVFYHLRLHPAGTVEVLDTVEVPGIRGGYAASNTKLLSRLLEVDPLLFAYCGVGPSSAPYSSTDDNKICTVTVDPSTLALTVSPVAGDSRWGQGMARWNEPMVIDDRVAWVHAASPTNMGPGEIHEPLPGAVAPPSTTSGAWAYLILVTVPGGTDAPTAQQYRFAQSIPELPVITPSGVHPNIGAFDLEALEQGWLARWWDTLGGQIGPGRIAIMGLSTHGYASLYQLGVGQFIVNDDTQTVDYVNDSFLMLAHDDRSNSYPVMSIPLRRNKVLFHFGWDIGEGRANAVGTPSASWPGTIRVFGRIAPRGTVTPGGQIVRTSAEWKEPR